ncbi:MAG: KpsF/GutQ family sugar-phosphate isomerase [Saprospiraceae bacterium]|nr:KpsF/GutQ family sugar-phosphate isomerase [Saprospiraceae bacterium]MDG1433138.1 KpsF/GutQ family sugar-phosphate isomerase [Saprospiraceae bacterium]MDG2419066.1 KpsF/GutQ family sugar-phosphate isomerase [Saprospiraceae bacterium]
MNKKEIISSTALKTIRIEAAAINALEASVGQIFCKCVEAIFESKGRLIVTGIGKSAIIAKKMVATFNSTGTPAVFMHAADAIHGDLGIVQTDDIVLCISKSGETSEIKVLVPLVKKLGSLMIGMVSNVDSFLAKKVDYILHTPCELEADPNNLAPTASTASQMAMGDAVATSLLALRGFTANDFAQYHPGGALGKQLYLRVNDIYPQNNKPFVLENENIRNTIIEMTSKRLGVAVVVDESEDVKGIITDGDLRRMLLSKNEVEHLKAKDIMSKNPQTIDPNEMAVKALEVMRSKSITQLIVVDEEKYLGVIHLHDLLREGLV